MIQAKSIDETITMERIAEVLMKTLSEDSAHVCAGEKVTRAEAAAVLLRAWQRFCETFGKTYRFDEQLEPIRTLMSEL